MSRYTVFDIVNNAAEAALADSGYRPSDPEVAKAVTQVATDVDTALDSALDTLRQEARALGASNTQIDAIFAKAGLNHDPEPEPEVEESEETDEPKGKKGLKARVAALEAQVAKALEFARSNGFRG